MLSVMTSQTLSRSSRLAWKVTQFLLDFSRQPVAVGVVQLHVERLQPAQHREADTSGRHGADMHAFEIIGALDAIGDVPAAFAHPIVRRDVIAHEAKDHHHHVLGHADAVAIGDFRHRDSCLLAASRSV